MLSFFHIVFLSVVAILPLIAVHYVNAECSFSKYGYLDSGIFLQKFGENHKIVNFPGNVVRIPDQGRLEVVCSSGFSFPGHPQIFGNSERELGKDFEEYRNISMLCENGGMSYSLPGGLRQVALTNNPICKDNKAQFYKADVANCKGTGFLYGFMVKNVPVILAEFCVNIDEETTLFVNFIAGQRTAILEQQVKHNPFGKIVSLYDLEKYIFPLQAEAQKLLDQTFIIPGYENIAEYKLEYLSPIANYTPHFSHLADNFEFPNIIPIWTTLKHYNWRIFEELLKNEGAKGNLEIFAGSSGIVNYPYGLRCNSATELKISTEFIEIDVPLHIWYHVKSKNRDTNVVVIAVNTPIVEMDHSTIICDDICDDVHWLKPMKNSRKIFSLGYVYCCKPETVMSFLTGFPQTEHSVHAAKTENNNNLERHEGPN